MLEQPRQVPISELIDPIFAGHGVTVLMLRLDLADPLLNGNKPFKLFPNIELAQSLGYQTLLSFGGAWSNHIHALAEAGRRSGFRTIGVIRGDDGEELTQTLAFAQSCAMTLVPVSRQDYRLRHDPEFIDSLRRRLGDFYLIPEGGANLAGAAGCKTLAHVIQRSLGGRAVDEIVLACGTGTTLAGLAAGLRDVNTNGLNTSGLNASGLNDVATPHVRGIAVLKGAGFLRAQIKGWLELLSPFDMTENWTLETDYHCGGYARFPAYLTQFMHEFEALNSINLDPVYTAKSLFAVHQCLQKGLYRRGSTILVVHTGGLQGRQQA